MRVSVWIRCVKKMVLSTVLADKLLYQCHDDDLCIWWSWKYEWAHFQLARLSTVHLIQVSWKVDIFSVFLFFRIVRGFIQFEMICMHHFSYFDLFCSHSIASRVVWPSQVHCVDLRATSLLFRRLELLLLQSNLNQRICAQRVMWYKRIS